MMERHTVQEIKVELDELNSIVCEVMEDIGVTEEMVDLRRYVYLKNDVHIHEKNTSLYHTIHAVGSQAEGSTTLGMYSDRDMVYVTPYVRSILHGKGPEITGDADCFAVKNEMCCSQCCFLQLVPLDKENIIKIVSADETIDMTGYFACENQERVLLLSNAAIDSLASIIVQPDENFVQNGPAIRCYGSVYPTDFTLALNCTLAPDCEVLFTRPKPGHWPKQKTMTNAKQCEMFLVHPGNIGSTYDRRKSILTIKFTSEYSLFQWRMSTNMIERLLMFDLNIVQMKAYILTKMIRKELLGPIVDNRLSTFHIKTSLLFTIEQFPENIWRNHNLLMCVMYCLNTLRRFLKRRFCPHYTIASVNLFENKLKVFEMKWLETEISAIIQSNLGRVLILQMDNFGQRLVEKLGGISSQLSTKEETRSLIICHCLINVCCDLSVAINIKTTKSRSEVDAFLNNNAETALFVLANDHKYRYETELYLNDIFNTKASIEASQSIENNIGIADAIDELFRDSLRSGNISCYLKYVSMLVCTH
ncbi:hypothetical protein DPMN_110426 [Dreissena polymorpha]|uniref:Mab-21-like HhH/H2TH-like domain-containing protein n=1 Tax=Dreissena polymorpha TaxID=45954 RepID=A0A9D4KCJ8_DREPO|nr:hypothetical protein DPMN_110426 [Dreissena polymorpha]